MFTRFFLLMKTQKWHYKLQVSTAVQNGYIFLHQKYIENSISKSIWGVGRSSFPKWELVAKRPLKLKICHPGRLKKDERRCFEQFISTSSAENFDLKLRWNLKFALRARHLKRVEESASHHIRCVIFTVRISEKHF